MKGSDALFRALVQFFDFGLIEIPSKDIVRPADGEVKTIKFEIRPRVYPIDRKRKIFVVSRLYVEGFAAAVVREQPKVRGVQFSYALTSTS